MRASLSSLAPFTLAPLAWACCFSRGAVAWSESCIVFDGPHPPSFSGNGNQIKKTNLKNLREHPYTLWWVEVLSWPRGCFWLYFLCSRISPLLRAITGEMAAIKDCLPGRSLEGVFLGLHISLTPERLVDKIVLTDLGEFSWRRDRTGPQVALQSRFSSFTHV